LQYGENVAKKAIKIGLRMLWYIAHLNSIPARLKGMRFGKNSYIGLGYDFIFVRLKNVSVGNNVWIGSNAWISTVNDNSYITIEDETRIGRNATIACVKEIRIGKYCILSYNVSILDHDHEFHNLNTFPIQSGLTEGKKIVIEDGCFIGAHSFILKGVHLGKHCVVGANSVVTKSFPAYSVVAGNPAKLIEKLN
jgi:acetyltransferase-like isoleucine patch superfamily enzyme